MNDQFTNAERAEVLTAALPYIKRYNGKIVVVKYGGNAMINEQLKQQVMEDIVLLWLIGVKIVLVHGGDSIQSFHENVEIFIFLCDAPVAGQSVCQHGYHIIG